MLEKLIEQHTEYFGDSSAKRIENSIEGSVKVIDFYNEFVKDIFKDNYGYISIVNEFDKFNHELYPLYYCKKKFITYNSYKNIMEKNDFNVEEDTTKIIMPSEIGDALVGKIDIYVNLWNGERNFTLYIDNKEYLLDLARESKRKRIDELKAKIREYEAELKREECSVL